MQWIAGRVGGAIWAEPTEEETNQLLRGDCAGLSWTRRLALAFAALALGLFFLFLASLAMLRPRAFAKFYTMGSLCIVGS